MKLSSTLFVSLVAVVCALATSTTAAKVDVVVGRIQKKQRASSVFSPIDRLPVTTNAAALSLRGGGGSLSLPEPLTVAKWYSRIGLLVQGVLMVSSPSDVNKMYGITSTPLRDWSTGCIGQGLIATFVFMHCLLDRSNLDVNHATAYSLTVWLVFTLRQVLNDKEAKAVGYQKEGFMATSLLHALTLYTVFAGHDAWADKLVKAEVIIWSLMGVLHFLDPQSTAKMWGQQSDIEDTAACLTRLFGALLISHHVPAALMLFVDDASAISTAQAFGYGALVWAVFFYSSLFVSKDCEKSGTSKLPSYGWALFHSLAAYLMLVGGGDSGGSTSATPST